VSHYFDKNTYRNLLTEVIDVAIKTEEKYDRILQVVEVCRVSEG
jgi:HTH-type transcriptional regulator/antitoxin HigA